MRGGERARRRKGSGVSAFAYVPVCPNGEIHRHGDIRSPWCIASFPQPALVPGGMYTVMAINDRRDAFDFVDAMYDRIVRVMCTIKPYVYIRSHCLIFSICGSHTAALSFVITEHRVNHAAILASLLPGFVMHRTWQGV